MEVPEAVSAAIEQARTAVARGRFRSADRTLSRALASHPDDPDLIAFRELTRASTQPRTRRRALAVVEGLRTRHPDRLEPLLASAGLAGVEEAPATGLELLDAASDRFGHLRAFRGTRAHLLAAAGRWDDAWAVYRELLADEPLRSSTARTLAIESARRSGHAHEAVTAAAGAGRFERVAIRLRSVRLIPAAVMVGGVAAAAGSGVWWLMAVAMLGAAMMAMMAFYACPQARCFAPFAGVLLAWPVYVLRVQGILDPWAAGYVAPVVAVMPCILACPRRRRGRQG